MLRSPPSVLCACTDLDKGDEVTFQYAKEGNGRLLLDYGFAELHGEGDEGKGGEGGNDGGNGSEFVDLEQLDVRPHHVDRGEGEPHVARHVAVPFAARAQQRACTAPLPAQ